jgi:Zn-dependent peptidase ImmA (M78 family)
MLTRLRLADPTPTEIVERYTQDAPVRVEAIARDLGIPVIQDVLDEAEIAGKIIRDNSGRSPSGYTIYLNARDPIRRQRFTLAHELAHYVLHRDLIGDGLIDDAMYRSKLGEWYETQANRWAADTLMPAALTRGLYRGGMVSLADLSRTLDVSEQAIRIRLSELGLAP